MSCLELPAAAAVAYPPWTTAVSATRPGPWQTAQASLAEDGAKVLADARVAELFRGLSFVRVDDQAGSFNSLIQEIWRVFLVAMLVSLVLEAALCLPKVARAAGVTT